MELGYLQRLGVPTHDGAPVKIALPEETVNGTARAVSASAPSAEPAAKGKAAPKPAAKAAAAGAPAAAAGDGSLGRNFLTDIIDRDLAKGGRCGDRPGKTGDIIRTRFPPEPNGYLHIGHAKSICINFGLAKQYGGRCHLRFDDTNPAAEEMEYVKSIQEDVKWLGFDWGEHLYFASDYFDQLFEWAELLVRNGKAYVDSQTAAEMRERRGSLVAPGTDSPFRTRSPEENMKLFHEMRDGKHAEGTHILRAKIDMKHPNMNMRDPPIYRILHRHHHNTGDKWKVYPLYDFAHGEEDAIEGITHSICTLEFEAHRELYNWFTSNLPIKNPPQQFEFARLNVTNTVMSKRKLLALVKQKIVDGWNDPRMPTICGMRRRGVPAEALRNFVARIGVTTSYSTTDVSLLEEIIREELEPNVARKMVVLDPIKVVVEGWPKGKVETTSAQNHPSKPELGSRDVKFSGEVYIERSDFEENPPDSYFRLKPGGEVKLRYSYVIKCKEVKKGKDGAITEIRCTYDPATRDSLPTDRKVKGVIHWVDANHNVSPEVRLYDYLLKTDSSSAPAAEAAAEEPEDDVADPNAEVDSKTLAFMKDLNPDSLKILKTAKAEESVKACKAGERFQFERNAFFVVDSKYSKEGAPVFNRIVGLKESAAKPDKDEGAAARSRKAEQAKQAAEKEAKKKLDPKEMFKSQTDLYSAFDEDGVPTTGADGEPLPKKRIKKLREEWEKQKKLFNS